MRHSPPGIPPAPSAWAEVQAHGRVIRYRRYGRGPAVVLLGGSKGVELLANSFRVIVPETPEPGTQAGPWLAAFLEGLGARSVAIVAEEPYYDAAVTLARLDPDRVALVARKSDLLGHG